MTCTPTVEARGAGVMLEGQGGSADVAAAGSKRGGVRKAPGVPARGETAKAVAFETAPVSRPEPPRLGPRRCREPTSRAADDRGRGPGTAFSRETGGFCYGKIATVRLRGGPRCAPAHDHPQGNEEFTRCRRRRQAACGVSPPGRRGRPVLAPSITPGKRRGR